MDNIVLIFLAFVAPLGVLGVCLVYLLMNPEKVEKWGSILWRVLAAFGGLFKSAKRKYVQYDLQGRINDFTTSISASAPYLAERRVVIEWTDPGQVTKAAFLADGKVILRLQSTVDNDMNFVRGSYLFVSTSLLHKAKRYISPTQRDAIDLFVTAKLLEAEKPHIVSYFLEEFLHPKTVKEDSRIVELFDAFARLREGGLFYEVLLQELQYLGDKVFGGRQDDTTRIEVAELIRFLDRVANRNIGDESVPLEFTGGYCRFGIVIVGKSWNITPGGEVWSRFIGRHVTPQEVETLYLVGSYDVHEVMDRVGEAVEDTYELVRSRKARVRLYFNGEPTMADNYLVVLRRRGTSVFGPSRRPESI